MGIDVAGSAKGGNQQNEGGAEGENRTPYAGLFRAALYQ